MEKINLSIEELKATLSSIGYTNSEIEQTIETILKFASTTGSKITDAVHSFRTGVLANTFQIKEQLTNGETII